MKTRTNNLKKLYGAVAAIAVAVTTVATSFAATGHSYTTGPAEVVTPNDSVFGMTYGDWGAAWWQWVQSIPAPDNPILDQAGDKCAQGQESGPVFFLVGTWGYSDAVRNCTIPGDKYLFFPILNVIASTIGEDPIPDEATLRQWAVGFTDLVDLESMSVTIDGKKVKNLGDFRAQSPAFDFSLPEDNLFGADAGSYSAVTDGYWLMLKPLSPGQHQIHFKGAFVEDDGTVIFALDVTYNLTVE